jgi:heme-degrading monooxygenase HmoA
MQLNSNGGCLLVGHRKVPRHRFGEVSGCFFKEGHMVAKILIKRRFKPGNARQVLSLLNELRSRAMLQFGYISGETLSQKDFPNNMTVIGTWQSLDDWYRWRDSDERNKLEAMLALYQNRPTKHEEFLLGSPLMVKDDFDLKMI